MFRFRCSLRERWGTLDFGERIHPMSETRTRGTRWIFREKQEGPLRRAGLLICCGLPVSTAAVTASTTVEAAATATMEATTASAVESTC